MTTPRHPAAAWSAGSSASRAPSCGRDARPWAGSSGAGGRPRRTRRAAHHADADSSDFEDAAERIRLGFREAMGAGRLPTSGTEPAEPTPREGARIPASLRVARAEPPVTAAGAARRTDGLPALARRAPLVALPTAGPVPYAETVVAAPRRDGPAPMDAREAWAAAQPGLAAFRAELAAAGGLTPTARGPGEPETPLVPPVPPSQAAAPHQADAHEAPRPIPLPRFLQPRIAEPAPEPAVEVVARPGPALDASPGPSPAPLREPALDASPRPSPTRPSEPVAEPVVRPQPAPEPAAPPAPVTEAPIRVEPADEPAPVRGAPAAIRRGAVRPARTRSAPPMEYERPPLELLTDPGTVERHHLSDEALEENARLLEGVLDDYGVKGEIVSVRPGPVVTMYELEPAPGLKASRVIGLADDIARSMSALSARVSTVPGRSVIGIELPNDRREKVVLREILRAQGFEGSMRLPLALGKDIGGDPVVANLAKMPHLLIAGTTGSGKSVAINTMILSLLYTLSPEECRLIMIDPKMLELSVYDGIPHLLSPVVTDPKKAVVALKWVVCEMEERYRRMSKLGVRNIEGFNGRVREALAKGETFTRTVQTGFDDETGDPVWETDETVPETMPYIVVVVDEMADLMMVAGKEIEACIQRLAQMARASGIHLIMATQRPSVDVITGTIKANFPTRISFQVTSKIDSRTILGEMGAEQLLGQGDMLHMAGGGRIARVHGPFVSDEEVEEVVAHLKALGPPEYVGAVVEGPEEGEASVDAVLGLADSGGEDALYDQAVAIVAKDRKCSTSYIQRKLGIGYNKAARLVEQMEEEGVVSPSNHVGRRDVLVPEAP